MLQKMIFLCFCRGPLFVGAPVRPNMLNTPKSVSEVNKYGTRVLDWQQPNYVQNNQQPYTQHTI